MSSCRKPEINNDLPQSPKSYQENAFNRLVDVCHLVLVTLILFCLVFSVLYMYLYYLWYLINLWSVIINSF